MSTLKLKHFEPQNECLFALASYETHHRFSVYDSSTINHIWTSLFTWFQNIDGVCSCFEFFLCMFSCSCGSLAENNWSPWTDPRIFPPAFLLLIFCSKEWSHSTLQTSSGGEQLIIFSSEKMKVCFSWWSPHIRQLPGSLCLPVFVC